MEKLSKLHNHLVIGSPHSEINSCYIRVQSTFTGQLVNNSKKKRLEQMGMKNGFEADRSIIQTNKTQSRRGLVSVAKTVTQRINRITKGTVVEIARRKINRGIRFGTSYWQCSRFSSLDTPTHETMYVIRYRSYIVIQGILSQQHCWNKSDVQKSISGSAKVAQSTQSTEQMINISFQIQESQIDNKAKRGTVRASFISIELKQRSRFTFVTMQSEGYFTR